MQLILKKSDITYIGFFIMDKEVLDNINKEISEETNIDENIIKEVINSYFNSIKEYITSNFVGVIKLDYLLKIVHKDSEKRR